MRRLSTALMIASIPLAVARADDPAPTGDLAKIQGAWTAKVGPDKDIPITVTIKGSKVALEGIHNGQDFTINGELKLDEKAGTKTIDWIKFVGPRGNDIPDNLGIYKLDGDSLSVCSGGPGNERPTEFKAGDEGRPSLTVFARKKGEPKGDDLAKLQGKWTAVAGQEKDKTIALEIKDKAVKAKYPTDDGRVLDLKGELVLNESASPPTIDFVKFKGDDGDDIQDILGVYKLEGDALKLCVGNPGDARPAEFKAGEGNEAPRLWTFTRPK